MPASDVWQQFLEADRRGAARPEIEESWVRSRQSGVDPERLDLAPAEFDPETLLVAVGSRVIPGTADLLVGDAASVALVDPRGTLTWRWESDPALRRDLQQVEVEPGHRYVEDGVGTCGVGLSMAVRSASMVVGAEHYKQAWHPYTCATAPIVDPTTRLLLGSVNVCCRAEHTNRFVMAAVVAFAERLRSALRDAATPRQRRLVDAHMTFRSLPGTTVITLDGEIMISDGGPAATLPDRATLWAMLREAGPSATHLPLGDGRVATVRPVTPGRFEDGCVLIFSAVSVSEHENPLQNAEAEIIREVLVACRGNKTAAAHRLGMARGTLYKRIRRYGLGD
ncbi:helix-turn-helix domain-containing protein [Amycolatopsis sp. NPDC047767]|uniref:helix-turn-helix domain-containing protein n=1 Tax=Amycolatopsis sp. NPDC047767 TaxID=3156765 RepID=UPI003451DDFE